MAQVDIPLDSRRRAPPAATRARQRRRDASSSVSIDSRAVPPGALFFAINGERFDGHDFAAQAVAAGADGVVVQRGRGAALDGAASATVIEVDDTVAALGALGARAPRGAARPARSSRSPARTARPRPRR